MSAPNLGIDSEDLGCDIIPAIERSFGFEFEQVDLADVRTYGELCTAVLAKLSLETATDCASQQAFYKLRHAIRLHAGTPNITPASQLVDIFPSQCAQRREVAAAIEQQLGMKLQLLKMPSLVEGAGCLLLVLGFLYSLIGGFLLGVTGILTGLASIAVAVVLFDFGSRFGSTLNYTTVREAVFAMSSKHYRHSRRNPSTINPYEIIDQLNYLFMDMAGVTLAELKPNAIL